MPFRLGRERALKQIKGNIKRPGHSDGLHFEDNTRTDTPSSTLSRTDFLDEQAGDARTGVPGSINEAPQRGPPTQTPEVLVDAPWTPWKELKELAGVLALAPVTNSFRDVKEMVDLFLVCADKWGVAEEAKAEFVTLRVRLEELFKDLKGHFSEGNLEVTPSMQSLCRSIQTELGYIRKQQYRDTNERFATTDESDRFLACYHRIKGHLQRLSLNANLSMWRVAQEQAANSHSHRMSPRVERLPSSLPAWYDSAEGIELKRGGCTPGTRADVLANILDWTDWASTGGGGGGVYWLSGMAGIGKTTIAYSVCAELDTRRQLGASFFCSLVREECRNLHVIIPSIAYQLARFSGPFHSALSAILEKSPDAHTRLPHMQFDALIAQPMLEVKHTFPEVSIVVIDALDECEQKDSTAHMLDVLLSKSANLPVKFIVSSRPESQIRDQMASERTRSRLVLHDLNITEADIKKYLRKGLAPMSPSKPQIGALAERAGTLFIYATTVVRYIGHDNFSRNPSARLRKILDRPQGWIKARSELDELYTTILEAAFGDEGLEEADRVDMQQVLYTVIHVREPLTMGGLSELLQFNDTNRIRAALRPWWPVLHMVEESELVTTLHASFPGFMVDPARSRAYHCDSDAHNRALAKHCFQCIAQTQPQVNICGLETSYVLDEQVPNLEERIDCAISSGLFYACRYWADHLIAGRFSQSTIDQLHTFLSARLLLWMEVMNLKKQMKTGVQCMKLMTDLCNEYEGGAELASLVYDAKNFVEAFASSPVSQSTPHLYISSLQLCPRSSIVYQFYSNYIDNLLKPYGGVREHQGVATSDYQPWEIGSGVLSIAYSPDETRVAVGCEDGTVNVFNAQNGSILAGPLGGHTDWVRCVVFSPDGAYILSASSDYTIRMWNALDGTPVDIPFEGHTYPVKSIAFSPDSRQVVSGSWDNTVRIWNAADGTPAMEPLEGHKWGVNCVAFSPDGTYVASGANDHTVRLWDLVDNIASSKVFEDHTNAVMSITFTPDGTRLVSGSVDCTICIWDIYDGSLVTHLLQGCNHLVYSVAISPDGTYVASGAADSTIRIWDINDGQLVAGPFVGHSSGVRSVIFSPSGSQILSGSQDQSIRIWDVHHAKVPDLRGAPSQSHPTENCAPHNTRIEEIADGKPIHNMSTSGSTNSKNHTVQVWTIHPERLSALSHQNYTSALVTSFAWLLDCPHLVYRSRSNDDAIAPMSGGFTHNPGYPLSQLLQGWKCRSDGWVVNDHAQLLFWAPSPSTALRIINRALSVTPAADSKALIWFSELKLGNWWQESHVLFAVVRGKPVTRGAEAKEPRELRSGSKSATSTFLNRLAQSSFRESFVQK
ncbi:unnamed protein product [Rhizoctonia solani]|uniref:Nephrocystin 3-like N-terminal domain-containing protein n=3 Tax=Rhizoctonia solani TaxID=456999 RepID=A0A8H3HJB0_9AGAM|nr:vegetative incompatibility protein HET-E-1, putative [Rhizoctonia solani AG-3 Rhs1AP]KEP49601.1 putative vegetative incompatibility protein HET-E-1 [Rhizoctonia solani 123E]CAE6521482.1 unnamed protein product [Rhizoctonia solani]